MTQKIVLIGDIHGKFNQYTRLLEQSNNEGFDTIQLGDFGVGFEPETYSIDLLASHNEDSQHCTEVWMREHEAESAAEAAWNPLIGKKRNRFIRGNHDNPKACFDFPNYIKDGTCETSMLGTKMFFLGGGLSIDKEYRTEGIDWWSGEELSYGALNQMVGVYENFKPDVVFTHDCPTEICFNQLFKGKLLEKYSRTGNALQSMFEIHQPKLWVFGHFHMHRKEVIQGCEFVCLKELQTMSITV